MRAGWIACVLSASACWPTVVRATETEPTDPLITHRDPELEPPPEPPPPPPPEPTPPGDVELLPPLALARVAGLELPPRPSPADPTEIAEDRIDRDLRRALRHDAIGAGRVDGYFHDLGRAMRAELHVDPRGVQEDLFRGASIPEAIVRELGRYGPASAPIDPRGTPLPEARTTTTIDPYEREALDQFDVQNFLNGHVTWHRVEIRVLQNRIGEVFDAQILRSSGMPTIDGAALEAARAAVVEAPPPDVIEGRETISSDWAIEVGDVGTDPRQVGCVDPAALLGGGCAGGGRGILRFRFELLDVVDGEHPPE